jgi:hypothetical protein
LDDLKGSYGSRPFTLEEILRHPAQPVWFAVFKSDRMYDLRLIYIFDVQQHRFIGKITLSLA